MNLGQACCVCAGIPFPGLNLLLPEQNSLLLWIRQHLDIQVAMDQRIPTKVCVPCVEQMLRWKRFRDRCSKAQIMFHKYWSPNFVLPHVNSTESTELTCEEEFVLNQTDVIINHISAEFKSENSSITKDQTDRVSQSSVLNCGEVENIVTPSKKIVHQNSEVQKQNNTVIESRQTSLESREISSSKSINVETEDTDDEFEVIILKECFVKVEKLAQIAIDKYVNNKSEKEEIHHLYPKKRGRSTKNTDIKTKLVKTEEHSDIIEKIKYKIANTEKRKVIPKKIFEIIPNQKITKKKGKPGRKPKNHNLNIKHTKVIENINRLKSKNSKITKMETTLNEIQKITSTLQNQNKSTVNNEKSIDDIANDIDKLLQEDDSLPPPNKLQRIRSELTKHLLQNSLQRKLNNEIETVVQNIKTEIIEDPCS